MNDETTLLPCPMCGGEAETHETIDGWIAACSSEQSELDGFTHKAQAYGVTEAEAIAAWNTRAYLNPDGLPTGLTISDDGNLLNWRGENYVRQLGGTLTAEQVRKVLLYHLPHREYYSVEQTDAWQAIADKLNALLGSGTCEPKWTLQGKTQTQEFWRCECGNCGYAFGVEDRQSRPWHIIVGSVDVPNFCPECGIKQKAVKR